MDKRPIGERKQEDFRKCPKFCEWRVTWDTLFFLKKKVLMTAGPPTRGHVVLSTDFRHMLVAS